MFAVNLAIGLNFSLEIFVGILMLLWRKNIFFLVLHGGMHDLQYNFKRVQYRQLRRIMYVIEIDSCK